MLYSIKHKTTYEFEEIPQSVIQRLHLSPLSNGNQKVIDWSIGIEGANLELKSKDIGKYYTNENFIFINEIKIDRKNLKYQRFSSFRGDCEAFKDLKSFKKNFDIELLTKENKI